MSDAGASKRYCAMVNLEGTADRQRIAEAGNALRALLTKWSGGDMEMLCASADARLVGLLFRSNRPLPLMRADFERSSATRNGDSLIIFEIGEDFTWLGFSRAGTWLQRH